LVADSTLMSDFNFGSWQYFWWM